jgi:hypothetical protein
VDISAATTTSNSSSCSAGSAKEISSRASLDSNSSGEEGWTHVCVSDREDEEATCTVSVDMFLKELEHKSSRDALLQEVLVLKSFVQSQLQAATAITSNNDVNVGYSPASPSFLRKAGKAAQDLLNCFGSDEFVNAMALDSNPSYLARSVLRRLGQDCAHVSVVIFLICLVTVHYVCVLLVVID